MSLDLTAAFDKIDHKILLRRLEASLVLLVIAFSGPSHILLGED